MPKQWVPPSEAFSRFASLGIDVEDVLDYEKVHIAVTCFVLGFLSLLFLAGKLREETWLNPSSGIKKYAFLALGFSFKFITGACFLPLMKLLLWPLAAWEQTGPTIFVGTLTACCLTCVKIRLARIDTELRQLDMTTNVMDWSKDRVAPEIDDEARGETPAFTRKQLHSLSLRSPHYDIAQSIFGLLSLLNSLFCARLPDYGLTTASIQVVLGIGIVLTGCYYVPYFPPARGFWDQNRLQNATDVSMLLIYLCALAATIATQHCSTEVLNSVWIAGSPLLMLPGAFCGYHLQSMLKARREFASERAYSLLRAA